MENHINIHITDKDGTLLDTMKMVVPDAATNSDIIKRVQMVRELIWNNYELVED